MLGNVRLSAKIMLAMGVSLTLVALALISTNLYSMQSVIDEAERNELNIHVRDVTQTIQMEGRMAEALGAAFAALPPVQERLAAGDRAALLGLLQPVYRAVGDAYGVEQFQLHVPPAISFLRLHKPEKFGDDLSAFRKTVVGANESRKPVRGLEGGVAGLGIRGVVPVQSQGRHVGSLEFGLTFAQDFFDQFRSRQGVDVALHLANGDSFVTYASTLPGKQPVLPAAQLGRAMSGDSAFVRTDVQAIPRAVYGVALHDFSGKRIGVLEVVMDRSKYAAALSSARLNALLIGGAVMLGGLVWAWMMSNHLAGRIFAVKSFVQHVASGDLTQTIQDQSQDELGQLSAAADRMRAELHQLAQDVRAHAHGVLGAARDITGAVESQAATSSQMSASVAEITSTMEELSASSSQIAEHSRSVVDIANLTYEHSKKGSEAMEGLLDRMAAIRSDNQESLQEILDLGKRSKEISKVMEIINSVADQTKLIAFNAALEAASAGDAGRRFGVVAAEIRRLADSVTESTSEIESKIAEIQSSISRLVITSEKGAHGISAGMDATAHTNDRLSELVGAARQTTSAAQQISMSTQQQRTASNQVVVALREIVTASSHTAQSIARISDISRDMAQLSGDLDVLVKRFRLRDSAAS